MEGLSHDQFKVNHLLSRIATLTTRYEEEIANDAVQLQLLVQDRDQVQQTAEALARELENQTAEVERMRKICEENGVNYGPDAEPVAEGETQSD